MSFTLDPPVRPRPIASSSVRPAGSAALATPSAGLSRQCKLAHALDEACNCIAQEESAADQLKRLPYEPNFALTRFTHTQPEPTSRLERIMQALRHQNLSGGDKVDEVKRSEVDMRRWTLPRYLGDSQRHAVYVACVALAAQRVIDALDGETFVVGPADFQFVDMLPEHETAIQDVANDFHYSDPRVGREERVLHSAAHSALTRLRQRVGLASPLSSEALASAERSLRDAYLAFQPANELIPYTLPRLLDAGRVRQFAMVTALYSPPSTQAAAEKEVQQVMQSCFALDKHLPRPSITDAYEETYF